MVLNYLISLFLYYLYMCSQVLNINTDDNIHVINSIAICKCIFIKNAED